VEIEYRYGDLLKTEIPYIAHCVNTQGTMGAGVAKTIRQLYPKAYTDYIEVYDSGGLKLGKVICSINEPHNVLHIVGQSRYGNDGFQYLNYIALRRGLKTINKNVQSRVAFPLIGCGLAGGTHLTMEYPFEIY
jgi:O-acetyl-ADP-ribose deacetylase (regulator of RNase III)